MPNVFQLMPSLEGDECNLPQLIWQEEKIPVTY